jgi:hypothetical protein
MGWPFDVYGWTFGINPVTNREEWHYVAVYQGRSLIAALWHGLRACRHYGCVKLELRT